MHHRTSCTWWRSGLKSLLTWLRTWLWAFLWFAFNFFGSLLTLYISTVRIEFLYVTVYSFSSHLICWALRDFSSQNVFLKTPTTRKKIGIGCGGEGALLKASKEDKRGIFDVRPFELVSWFHGLVFSNERAKYKYSVFMAWEKLYSDWAQLTRQEMILIFW